MERVLTTRAPMQLAKSVAANHIAVRAAGQGGGAKGGTGGHGHSHIWGDKCGVVAKGCWSLWRFWRSQEAGCDAVAPFRPSDSPHRTPQRRRAMGRGKERPGCVGTGSEVGGRPTAVSARLRSTTNAHTPQKKDTWPKSTPTPTPHTTPVLASTRGWLSPLWGKKMIIFLCEASSARHWRGRGRAGRGAREGGVVWQNPTPLMGLTDQLDDTPSRDARTVRGRGCRPSHCYLNSGCSQGAWRRSGSATGEIGGLGTHCRMVWWWSGLSKL